MSTSSIAVRVAASMLAAVSVVFAQTSRDGQQPAQTTSARMTGRVVESVDRNQPVRRAIVTIVGSRLPAGRSSITDDDGRFVFDRIPAGSVTLSATRAGYLRAVFGATRPGRPGTPITLGDGADLRDVTIEMTHGSAVDGVVRDVAGDPAPGLRVEAIRLSHRADGDRGETAGAMLTDDRGEYRIYGLPAGDYVLVATPAAIISGIGDIGAPSESEVDAILASLPRHAPVSNSPAAPGTPGQRPQAADRAGAPAAKGYATPPTYYPGVLQSGEATRVTLGANDSREGLDFAVRLSHSADVDGVIVPVRGQQVPQLQVAVRSGGPQLPVFGGMGSGPQLSMRPAEHTFHISNVPPGHYRITARTFGAPGGSPGVIASGGALPKVDGPAEVQWASVDIEVGGDDVAGVSLVLQPALRVRGKLSFDRITPAPAPDPSGLRLALQPVADADGGSNGLTAPLPATIHADGTFEIPAVIPGSYRLTLSNAGTWWMRSAIAEGRDILDAGLVVSGVDPAPVGVTLSDRHTSIAGTLSAASGAPAPSYFIVAFASDHGFWRAPSRRVRSTRPSTDGSFEFTDLPAGTYYLAALTDVDPTDLDDESFLQSLIPSAITLSLGEGERKRQDVKIR